MKIKVASMLGRRRMHGSKLQSSQAFLPIQTIHFIRYLILIFTCKFIMDIRHVNKDKTCDCSVVERSASARRSGGDGFDSHN